MLVKECRQNIDEKKSDEEKPAETNKNHSWSMSEQMSGSIKFIFLYVSVEYSINLNQSYLKPVQYGTL